HGRERLKSAVAMANEHFLGEIGNTILSRPQLLAGVDPRIARLFRWHGHEEVEHKAVLFDVLHAARGHGLYTYTVRITGRIRFTLPANSAIRRWGRKERIAHGWGGSVVQPPCRSTNAGHRPAACPVQ